MQFAKKSLVAPSATVEMNTLAIKKKNAGDIVYNLSVGEPMLPTPDLILSGANDAMRRGETHYPPVAGISELCRVSSQWMNRTYGTAYTEKQTLVTCGGKHGVCMALQALIEDGDEAILIAPFWVSYISLVQLFGGVPRVVETEEANGWRARPGDIERLCSARTKVLILNNGANPTGALYTRDELRAMLEVAREHNLIVISDEVYSGLVYDGREYVSCGSFAEYTDRVVIIQSCSKNFAMTGWRVGFAFGPEELIGVMTTLQGQSTTGTSTVSQWAAVAGFGDADRITGDIRAAMQARRDFFVKTFRGLFQTDIFLPPAALYSFIPIQSLGSDETDSTAFCLRALEGGNVGLVPGAAFGQEGYIRASFGGTEAQIDEGLAALHRFIHFRG